MSGWRLRVFLLAIVAAGAAAQAPTAGPARWLPGDAITGPVYGNEQTPALCAGGAGYLLVWADARSVPLGTSTFQQSDVDLYGRLLDAAGAPLGPDFPIVTDFGYQKSPSVAWNGESWLVAWVDQSPTAAYFADAAKAVRVSAQGQVLGEPFTAFAAASEVHVAANGSTWLLVTQSYDSQTHAGLVARRIAADGSLLDATAVTLVPAQYFVYSGIDVAVAHGQYLLTWSEINDPKARRFDAGLQPLGATFTLPAGRLASNGSDWFLAWNTGTLRASPLKADGSLLVPGGAVVASGFDAYQWELDATWDGDDWLVAWLHTYDAVRVARVTSAGAVLDPGGVVQDASDDGFVYGLQVAGGAPGAGSQTVWSDIRNGGSYLYDVRGRHASAALQPDPEAVLSVDAPAQMRVELAEYPGGFLATWESRLSTGARILVQRLDATGVALDAEPIELAAGAVSAPSAAWNGALFLVAWTDADGVRARRVGPDARPLDAASALVMPAGFTPDVAPLGDTFLVVGLKFGFNVQYINVHAVRVSAATGLPLDAPPPPIGGSYSLLPRVVAAGSRWLATWEQHPTHDDPQSQVMACFVEPGGGASAPFSVALNGGHPDVAFSGSEALFVFRVNSLSNANNDVWFRRMLPAGALDQAVLLSAGPGRQLYPVVAFDGTRFVAAWEDQRNQAAFYDGRTDVYAARISAGGTLLDPAGFAIENAETPEARPALAAVVGTPGASLAVTSVLRAEPALSTWRLAARAVGTPALWSDAGHALAGLDGLPFLAGSGALVGGEVVQLELAGAASLAPAALIGGHAALLAPFKGGVLVPAPELLLAGLLTAPGGALELVGTWPAGVPSGSDLFFQAWIAEAGTPAGWAASNAVHAVAP